MPYFEMDDVWDDDTGYEGPDPPLTPAEESVLEQDRRAELEYGVGWCDF